SAGGFGGGFGGGGGGGGSFGGGADGNRPAGGASLAASGGDITAARIDTHPHLPSAHSAHLLGLVAQNQHDFGDALAFFEAALAQDPSNGDIASHLFVLAVINGQFDIAAKLVDPLLTANPSAPLVNLVALVEHAKAQHLAA